MRSETSPDQSASTLGRRRFLAGGVSAIVVAGAVRSTRAAAATDSEPDAEPDDTAASAGSTTVTITDVLGTREIPAAPQRVVCLDGRVDLELAVMCGFPVVGYYDRSTPATPNTPEVAAAVADAVILPFDIDLEQLASLEPDLIIQPDTYWIDEIGLDKFDAIAPSLITMSAADKSQADWREEFRYFADSFGRGEQADAELGRYEALIDEIAAEFRDAITETDLVLVQSNGPDTVDLVIHRPDDLLVGAVVGDLGGHFGSFQADLAETTFLSAEQIGLIDGEVMILSGYELEPGAFDVLDANPLWGQVPAVENDAVVTTSVLVVNFGGVYGAIRCAELLREVYRTAGQREV